MSETLVDDSRHMTKTNILQVSKAQEEAHRRLNNKFFSHDEIKKVQTKYNIPPLKDNQNNSKDNQAFQNQIHDALIQTQIQVTMFQILEQYKESCRYATDENDEYIYDDKDNPVFLSEDEFKSKWDQELLELFLPRSVCEYDRNYSYMPEPFSHWDYRNFWQQYFFVEDEECIYYIRGGSGGSMQREYNGLFAHTFATLVKKYNHIIPTDIYVYSELNKFEQHSQYLNFKTTPLELSGNYQHTNKEIRETLFKGFLIQYTYNYETHEFKIVDLEKDD